MSSNYKQPGNTITVLAPATVSSGDGVQINDLFGVALGAAASGASVEIKTTGVFTLPKATGVTPAQGGAAYWDRDVSKVTTSTSSSGSPTQTNKKIGVFVAAYLSGDTEADVRLNGSF